MEDPEKAAKFRSQFIGPDGKIINCGAGDKLFIQTRVTLSAEITAQNFPLFVKSIIKSISGNVVTITDVEIIQEFRDSHKQGVIKNLDLSRFASQFRNKSFKLDAGGKWAIVHSGTPSGISRVQYQEDLPKIMGLSMDTNNDDTSPPQQNLVELQELADSLKQFDLSTTETKIIHEVIHECGTEIQCIASTSEIIHAYSEQQDLLDETSVKYIWVLQAVAECFGTTLLPDTEQGPLSTVVAALAFDKVETLHRAIHKVVQKITLDDDSIKLSNLITNPE